MTIWPFLVWSGADAAVWKARSFVGEGRWVGQVLWLFLCSVSILYSPSQVKALSASSFLPVAETERGVAERKGTPRERLQGCRWDRSAEGAWVAASGSAGPSFSPSPAQASLAPPTRISAPPPPGLVLLRPPQSRGGEPRPAGSWCSCEVFIMELAPRSCPVPPLLLFLGLSSGRFGQKMLQRPVRPSLLQAWESVSGFVLFKPYSFPLLYTLWNYFAFETHSIF